MKKIPVVFILIFLSVLIIAPNVYAKALPNTSDLAIPYFDKAVKYQILPMRFFTLNGTLNREDTAEFTVRIYESLTHQRVKPANPNPFKDTKNIYVLKAKTLGIVAGTKDGFFLPKENITREGLCKISYQLINLRTGYSFDFDTLSPSEYFADHDLISDGGSNVDSFREAIYGLRELNLIQGYPDGTFRPQGTVTCKESVVFFVNIYEYLNNLFYINDLG